MSEFSLPYHECSRFDACSANVCPLDPRQIDKEDLAGDEKCTLRKSVRNRIGKLYPELLKHEGLTQTEFNRRKRWAANTLIQPTEIFSTQEESPENAKNDHCGSSPETSLAILENPFED